jgi:hypothetical protein
MSDVKYYCKNVQKYSKVTFYFGFILKIHNLFAEELFPILHPKNALPEIKDTYSNQ